MPTKQASVSLERIQDCIYVIRGQKVILSADLSELYDVSVGVLHQAVKRNTERFPLDFMFQLTSAEFQALRSQFVILDAGRGQHPKYLPFAFTEQGVAMLSSVLHSPRAVQVNIEIMRAFVQLRQLLATADLAHKLEDLEKKYDSQFKIVFEAIRELMAGPEPVARKIAFNVRERNGKYRVNGNGARR